MKFGFITRASGEINDCVFMNCHCDEDQEDSNQFYEITCNLTRYGREIDDLDKATKLQQLEFPRRNPAWHGRSKHIASLYLNGNNLEIIPTAGNLFVNLSFGLLDLNENKIHTIDVDAFRGVERVVVLDLSYNMLHDLHEHVFEPIQDSLIQLKLGSNKLYKMNIKKLSDLLSTLHRLTHLSLNKNELKSVPDMSKMLKLSELSLESNKIESLGIHQHFPSSLNDLNLQHNHLRVIDQHSFANLVNLRFLDLSNNHISSLLPNAFDHLAQLDTLLLNKNHLKSIPSKLIFNLVYLNRLDLASQMQGNGIRAIADYAFSRLSSKKSIHKIDLSNNSIEHLSNRAFCSNDREHPYANIKEINLGKNAIANLNPCLMHQLSLGLNDSEEYSSSDLEDKKKKSRVKVSLKFSDNTAPNIPVANSGIKCDCDVTKSAFFVELEGKCAETQINLRNFRCSYLDPTSSSMSVSQECEKMTEYSCLKEPEEPEDSEYDFELETRTTSTSKSSTDGNLDHSAARLPSVRTKKNKWEEFMENNQLLGRLLKLTARILLKNKRYENENE